MKENFVGWGGTIGNGIEIWDTNPVFTKKRFGLSSYIKLLFYPKKFALYTFLKKNLGKKEKIRLLDVGCGTGATLVDLKKMFGAQAEVFGVDVVKLQIDLAKQKLKKYSVIATAVFYDGEHLPFPNNYFDGVYTSDVLGHVKDVDVWLSEINRVLKPDAPLAMFSESRLGKFAVIRNYLMKRGLNVDPHAKAHISLFSKSELSDKIEKAGFNSLKMYTVFWASFLVHPDEFYPVLQAQNKFFCLKLINKILYWLKKKTHPISMALAEFYGLVEMLTVGRYVESQGYVILGKKITRDTK